MGKSAVQIRYKEFIRRTGRAESADSVREFLHHEVLRILSAQNPSALILHGGCKTRYIDGSPRYSMDMDFSLSNIHECSREEREAIVHRAIDPVLRELDNVGITLDRFRERWYRGETGVKLCFKANRLKDLFPRLFADQPGDINFNIDIDALLPGERVQVSTTIADSTLRILVLHDATHMARKAVAVLLRNQLRDLYDLDMYINGGTHYDLDVVRHRLNAPSLSHEGLIERLCEKTQELDLKGRAHQLHLPNESAVNAFINLDDRIAAIKKMQLL
ncbi:MAG: nucleotidyl transferase AbiEii/AbiGii toxin family protein [Saccharofermentanales bacterium]